MNILILTQRGGIQNPNAMDIRFRRILSFFQKKGKCFIVYPADKNSISKNKNGTIITIKQHIKKRWIRRVCYRFILNMKIKGIIKNIKPDIIYTQDAISTVIFKKAKKAKKIYDIIGLNYSESLKVKKNVSNLMKSFYFKFIEKKGIRYADYILTVNEAHKKEIKKIEDKPVFVLRDGVDPFFLKPYTKKRKKDRIIISFVGSLGNMRLLDIINCMPKIIKANKKIFFNIIGDGKDLDEYETIVKKTHCKKNVIFKGYIKHDKIYNELKNSDICYSDDWSYIGFPTKVFEYMAMGKAVLVEDTPAVREIVKEGRNGLLYKDKNDLLKKIILLAKDKKLREKLGKQARKDVFKNHTWDKRIQLLDKIVKGIPNK